MTDGWIQKSKLEYQAHEPVFLTITVSQPAVNQETKENYIVSTQLVRIFEQKNLSVLKNSKAKESTYYSFFDFDESSLDVFQFKISSCYCSDHKKHFMFRLPSMFDFQSNTNTGKI